MPDPRDDAATEAIPIPICYDENEAAAFEDGWRKALAAPAPAPGDEGLRARLAAVEAERDDATGGYRVTREAVDRFRDVLADALGHADENPGDDALQAQVREHFGRTGPEPTRWRDFVTGSRAAVDQINAERRALASPVPAATDQEDKE